MKRSLLALTVAMSSTAAVAQHAPPPEIPYESAPNFLKLPADLHLGEASGVAVNSKGHVFVFSRGSTTGPAYAATAAQLLEFGADGKYLREIGHNTPHSIAADARGNIYVADRGNRRIQVFDADGGFLREIKIDVPVPPDAHPWMGAQPTPEGAIAQSGAPWAICITPGPNQVLYSSDAFPGRVYKLSLEGQVLGVLGKTGRQPKQFGRIHEIACPSENEIYVAEILNWRIQKLLLHPEKRTSTMPGGAR